MAFLCTRARPHDDSGVSVQCCRVFGVRSLPQLVQQAFIAENTCIIQAFLPFDDRFRFVLDKPRVPSVRA